MKRQYLSGLLIFTVLLFPVMLTAQGTLPKVTEINTTVSGDSLNSYVRILSGVDPVRIGATTYTITSRKPGTSTQTVARQYIRMKFESFGLVTYEQSFSGTYSGTNVYAVQMGKNPDQIYIICGHYDSVTSYAADDNATGVAAVIEAARILSKLIPEYTIVYAAWDREENGMVGSKYYAQQAKAAGKDIRAVINLDMLGWDSNNDGLAEIHVQNYANSVALANALVSANTAYGIGLSPVLENPGTTASDHSSFWNNGYSAILLIEGYYGGDFTPYYHKTTDQYATLNLNYLYKMSNMAITTLAGYVMNDKYVLAGRVFEDEDGLDDGIVDGTGTNLGEELFVHLIDGSGNVRASAVVGSDGSYTFPDVAGGSYTAQLTLTHGSVGSPMPATLLPAGWTYTGEHRGAGTGDDGQPDGLLSVEVTGPTNIREVRFGIGEAVTTLEGVFTYHNEERTPLEGVIITLEGAGNTYTATTGADGRYSFLSIPWGTYTVVTQSDQNGSGAVNAIDAAMVNAWQVGPQYAIEKVRFKAGDVSQVYHRLDAGDAGRINAFYLTGETMGWEAPVKRWSFWKAGEAVITNGDGESLPTVQISGTETVLQDFYGVITGDFNLGADLTFTGEGLLAKEDLKSAQALLREAPVTTIPEVKANVGETVVLPVSVTGFNQIGAVSLMITYDPAILANPVFTNTSGAIPGLGVNTSTAGVIRISGFTSAEAGGTLADQSTFFTLSFTYLGGTTEVAFSHPYTTSCQYAGPTPDYEALADTPKESYFINGRVAPALQPDLAPVLTVSPNVMNGPTQFDVLVRVAELQGADTEARVTVMIPRDSRWTMAGDFDPTLTSLGGQSVDNEKWSYDPMNSGYHVFNREGVISGGGQSVFGFYALFDPGNAKGVFTVTTQILAGSGGEVKIGNNSDAEKLDYFPR